MFSAKLNFRYLEHGMFYESGGVVSDIQTLAFTTGLSDSQMLHNALRFPKDTLFREVSFAFLPTDFGLAFIQIQRRREHKEGDDNSLTKSSGLFNQTRFNIVDPSEFQHLLSQGFCIFTDLIVNADGHYGLEEYSHVVGEVPLPELIINPPEWGYIKTVKNSKISNAIKSISRAIQNSDQVLVLYNRSEISLYERLTIAQEVERLVLPILGSPVSFALDYIVHLDSKIGIRFQTSDEVNRTKAKEVHIHDEIVDDYVELAFEYLFGQIGEWGTDDKLNWQARNTLLTEDNIATFFASQKRPKDAAIWLRNVVLSKDDTLKYFQTLLDYKTEINASQFNDYFRDQYKILKSDSSVFKSLLLDSQRAYNLLLSIAESEFLETDFSLREWVELVIYSNTRKEKKKKLFVAHSKSLATEDAESLIKWLRNKKEKIVFGFENIAYDLFKETLNKDEKSAELMIKNLADLHPANPEQEIKYWIRFLHYPKSPQSIWRWVKSTFRDLREHIFIVLLEQESSVPFFDEGLLHIDDQKKIKLMGNTKEFSANRLIRTLNKKLMKKTDKVVLKNDTAPSEDTQFDVINFEHIRHPDTVLSKSNPSTAKKEDIDYFGKDYKGMGKILLGTFLLFVCVFALANSSLIIHRLKGQYSSWLSSGPITTQVTTEVVVPNPTKQPSQNTNQTQTISMKSWRGRGYLYYIRTNDSNNPPSNPGYGGLFLLQPDLITKQIQQDSVLDVFVNSQNLPFYTTYESPTASGIRFLPADDYNALLIQPRILFSGPSIFPGPAEKYDALFVCNIFDLCLLSRNPRVEITRYDFDASNNTFLVDPWDGKAVHPSPPISLATWFDETRIILSFNDPQRSGILFIFDLNNQRISDLNILANSNVFIDNVFIDMARWPGSTDKYSAFALLSKKENKNIIYVLEVNNGVLAPENIKPFSLPEQIKSVSSLQWDPQKNHIAFLGVLENREAACNVGCMFLLDLTDGSIKLLDIGDGIISIYWSTSIR